MIRRLCSFATLVFVLYLGYRSYHYPSQHVETTHEISVENPKIHYDQHVNLLYLLKDREVTFVGSHNNFTISPINNNSFWFYSYKKTEIEKVPKHFVDYERDDYSVYFKLPAFQSVEFEVIDMEEPLQITAALTYKFCPLKFVFYTVQCLLFLFYPIGIVYEMIAFLLFIVVLVIQNQLCPMLNNYSIQYNMQSLFTLCNTYFFEPIFYTCNVVLLFASHIIQPLYGLYRALHSFLAPYILKYSTIVIKYGKLINLPFYYKWIINHPIESFAITMVVITLALILCPSRKNYNQRIRLVCVLGLSMSIFIVMPTQPLGYASIATVVLYCLWVLKETICRPKLA